MADNIEFHCGDIILLSMPSSHAPDRGDLVNIMKINYRVISRTYTVDHAATPYMREMVCVINMVQDVPS